MNVRRLRVPDQANKPWVRKIEDTMCGETNHQEPRTATGVTSEPVPAAAGIATTGMTGPGTVNSP
jgi:hypothetical protein